MNIDKELQQELLKASENDIVKDNYDRELKFYEMVSGGAYDALEARLKARTRGKSPRKGVLSNNELNDRKYHAIIMISLASRFCIEAGMSISLSYSISDIYIRKIDQATSVEEIDDLYDSAALDYCSRMRDQIKKNVISRHVVLAIDYVRANVHKNITVNDVADSLGLNQSYLSKLFKQEMGDTLSHYIKDSKIQEACNMLRHLEESSLNIASYLGFSSQSHFIQVFKKETGYTPEEYRKIHYHQSWMSNDG